jgi:uncharacterized membrane protein
MNDELLSRTVLFVVMVGSGVLLWWMARAAASGRLKRNQFVGIRLPSTMASDKAWLAAHLRAQRATTIAGIAAIISGLVALLPVPMPVVVIACSSVAGRSWASRCTAPGSAPEPRRRFHNVELAR